MHEIVWLDARDVDAIHREPKGAPAGLRDRSALPALLAKAQSLVQDVEEAVDLYDLAAALGHGIARGRPFAAGNARTAFVAAETFLILNGLEGAPLDNGEVVAVTLALAGGDLTRHEFAGILRGDRPELVADAYDRHRDAVAAHDAQPLDDAPEDVTTSDP